MRAIPYPADVRAKGWRFEIDYEKVEQSDTWSLAAEVPMAQHALLMMWLMAWTQVPCGSLPNDDAIIRAKCKVPVKLWTALQPVLMRGWWLAEDGRLYHDTIVARVLEMLEYRRKEAERRNRNRGKTPGVPELSRGTGEGHAPGHHGDSHGMPDTGTGTGTGTSSSLRSEEPSGSKYSAEFEAAWTAYPKRPGASKADTLKAWTARIKGGVDAAELVAGAQRYATFCRAAGTDPQFIKQPATFFGPGDHFRADWTFTASPPRTNAAGASRFAGAAAGIFDAPNQREVIDV